MLLVLLLHIYLPWTEESEPLCWRYLNTGKKFLKLDIQHSSAGDEVITLRGDYLHEKHTATDMLNGFFLSRNSSVPVTDVDIKIFNKDVVPEGGLVRVPTIIKYCCKKDYKVVFEDSTYSRDSDVIYQLLFTATSLTLRINSETIVIQKPPSPDPDYWKIGHVRQRGEATTFKEVSVCPLKVSTTIVKKGIEDAVLCLQGEECEATREIIKLMRRSIRMSCFASGIPPIQLWWSCNGANLTSGQGYRIITKIKKYITEIAFTLEEGTAGQYTCHAANTFNSSIYSSSSIKVLGYLPLSSYIQQRRLEDVTCARGEECDATSTEIVEFIGSEVNMSCVAFGTPPIEIWWSLEGKTLTNGTEYGIKVTNNATEITFTLEESNEGWYICHAAYPFKTSVDSEATIEVSGFLPLTTHILEPKYVVTQVGAVAKFTCVVYQWPLGSDKVFWNHLNTDTKPFNPQPTFIRDTDKMGRSREVHTLELLNVSYADSGVFRCGNDIASLFVERPVETPDVQFHRTETGEIEVSCSTLADPPADLDLHVRLDEYEKMWNVELQNRSSKRNGSFVKVTWTLVSSQEYLRIFFSCNAVQKEQNVETSGHAVFSKSLEIAMAFYTSQNNETNLHYGDNFTVECFASGNPSPDYLALVRGADHLIDGFKNENVTRYQVKLKRTFENVTGKEHGSYRCVANDTFKHNESFLRSGPLEIRVYQELTTVELTLEPDFVFLSGTLEVEENSRVTVKCSAAGGFPKPELVILYKDEIVDAPSESVNDTIVAAEGDVLVTETSELKCEAWQDRFGEEVMVGNQNIALASVEPVSDPWLNRLMSLKHKDILFWGGLCAIVTIVISIFVITVYLVYACCCRRRSPAKQFEPLSMSEEERLRTRSIDHASRRLELLSNLTEHPVSDPNVRITRALSRSRGSLESMRSRQRHWTQSGDIVQDNGAALSRSRGSLESRPRHRTQSGDILVQDNGDRDSPSSLLF